jgi:hypothetical protein
LQNRHSKWVTAKIFFLKGLWVLMVKPQLLAGAFFDSLTSLAGWGNQYGTRILLIGFELGDLRA